MRMEEEPVVFGLSRVAGVGVDNRVGVVMPDVGVAPHGVG